MVKHKASILKPKCPDFFFKNLEFGTDFHFCDTKKLIVINNFCSFKYSGVCKTTLPDAKKN